MAAGKTKKKARFINIYGSDYLPAIGNYRERADGRAFSASKKSADREGPKW